MLFKIRDKECFLLFLIAYTFIFIILTNGFDLVNKWQYQIEHDSFKTDYDYDLGIQCGCTACEEVICIGDDGIEYSMIRYCEQAVHSNMIKQILNSAYGRDETIYIWSFANINGYMAEKIVVYLLSYGEDWFYNIINGRNITKEDFENHDKIAIISDEIAQNAIKRGDDYYISVDNYDYKVVGIYESPGIDEPDVVLSYFPDSASEAMSFYNKLSEDIIGDDFSERRSPLLRIGGDADNASRISKEADNIINELSQIDNLSCQILDWRLVYGEDTSDLVYEKMIASIDNIAMSLIYIVLLLFCIANYAQIIGIFVSKRQRDYTIYRVCGCSNLRIVGYMLRELIPMLIYSFVAVFIINILYNVFFSDRVWYSITSSGICYIVVAGIGVITVSVLMILRKLKKINLVEEIMEI